MLLLETAHTARENPSHNGRISYELIEKLPSATKKQMTPSLKIISQLLTSNCLVYNEIRPLPALIAHTLLSGC